MRYVQINAEYYCGIDLHSRTMYVCVMDRQGNILFHRNMKNNFSELKNYLTPLNGRAQGTTDFLASRHGETSLAQEKSETDPRYMFGTSASWLTARNKRNSNQNPIGDQKSRCGAVDR